MPKFFTTLRDRFFSVPLHTEDKNSPGMLGSGVHFRKNSYVTHTTLHHSKSALSTFVAWQLGIIAIILTSVVTGFVFAPRDTAILLVGVLSFVYLLDVFFNLFVIMKSLHTPPEISVTSDELALLDYLNLPVYTILCPLYKEAHVLPQFVAAMQKMDWPEKKLEIMLLLEEDDQVTIDAARSMKLPKNFRIVVVPDGKPKTKPKACNYGLGMAKGEFIVVYDAEDQPDPAQLKQAYYAFRESSKKVVCLQAKLNYYNPSHNMLTRLFTAEYSLWFDVILPGLQSIGTSIPLGGTSNHFRTADLRELEGWDPFNVTEDCDLGARIFQGGYQTAIIDSTTLEEANSDVKNWFRQRSRWLKGYMQTYLVHMRDPIGFMRRQGIHSLIFQLIVGGRIAFILINPLLWLLTIAYFVLYSYLGPAIESIFPGIVFYMAVTSLLLGNFTYLYNYMIGCAKRGHWNLIKYVFLIPIYWLMISYAATIALFQLFFKPHYWEKTIHGLHLDHALRASLKMTAKDESRLIRAKRVQKAADLARTLWSSGGVMVFASFFNNFLNFAYNAFLSRRVDLSTFGDISLFSSFIYLSSIPISALSRTVTHSSGYLLGKYKLPVKQLWTKLCLNTFKISVGFSLIWLVAVPFIHKFFNTQDWGLFILLAPVWIISSISAVNGGFLSGNLIFYVLAATAIIEGLIKFFATLFFVTINANSYIYAATPIAMFLILLIESYQITKIKSLNIKSKVDDSDLVLSTKFFFTSVLTTLTKATYLGLDIILAKHYLSPEDAGIYSYISLAGKMVFFLSTMFSQFLIPYVSRDIGAGRSPRKTFLNILGLVSIVNIFAVIIFGYFGKYTAPILWGNKVLSIISYLPTYSLAMALFSTASLVITYQQIRKRYIFPIIGFMVGCLQIIGMWLYHGSIQDLVEVVVLASICSVVIVGITSYFYKYFIYIYHAILDFSGLFKSLPTRSPLQSGKLRILIFNWRDLRHKWAGGSEVYLHEISKRWVREGHEVTIFSGNDGKSGRHERIDGVKVIRHGGFYLVYFWAFIYYQLRLKGRYDLIIDSENGLPFFTPLYAKEKVFLLIHHVHQEVFRKSLIPPFSWIALFLEKQIMPIIYRKTEVVTVSPSSKDEIIAHNLTKKVPHIIYNGVNLQYFKPGLKSANPTILYLGRLTSTKSIHVLIKAFVSIIKKIPKAKLYIAGDGPSRKTLIKQVDNLNIATNVIFTGKVSEEKKRSLYQRAWVFVNPSLVEGWGITTIEANACGTMVVASDVPGLRDSVKNNKSGLLLPYGNHTQFASTLIKTLSDKKYRESLEDGAISWASTFSWERSASEMIRTVASSNPDIKKPSTLQLILANLASSRRPSITLNSISVPGYKLIRGLNSKSSQPHFFSGVYTRENNGKEKYYIKSYPYTTKNLHYYNLINQYYVSKHLYEIITSHKSKRNNFSYSTPKPISIIKSSTSISIIYEYIEGKMLNNYSSDYQKNATDSLATILEKITLVKSGENVDSIRVIKKIMLILSTPLLSINALLTTPIHGRVIIKSTYHAIKELFTLKSSNLVLTHRDIKPENIIVRKNTLYILDCEQMVYTIKGYDRAQIRIIDKGKASVIPSEPTLRALYKYILLVKLSRAKSSHQDYINLAYSIYDNK